MTYGFQPENWPAFQTELAKRVIAVGDIEKVEFRRCSEPDADAPPAQTVEVIVTLRSGRAESWRQPRRPTA